MFTTYGTIELEVLGERKLEVCKIAYDLIDPLVTIYDEIEELEYLGIAAANPYSQSQIVSYGLTIIKILMILKRECARGLRDRRSSIRGRTLSSSSRNHIAC